MGYVPTIKTNLKHPRHLIRSGALFDCPPIRRKHGMTADTEHGPCATSLPQVLRDTADHARNRSPLFCNVINGQTHGEKEDR